MGQISVKDITKQWGAFAALKNIDLDVRESEFLSIVTIVMLGVYQWAVRSAGRSATVMQAG